MSTPWEEARRCPEDGSPGEIVSKRPASRDSGMAPGSQIVTLECKNTRCPYNATPYLVQIRPDGTIPDPVTQRDKHFAPLSVFDRERGKVMVENLQEELSRQVRVGDSETYEVRR